jgi:hypothetical protein
VKRLGSRLERWVSSRFPNAYYQLVQRPRTYFRFATERKLVLGASLSQSQQRSIIFFTTQKCASRYVSRVIAALASSAGLVHADYDAYVSMVRPPKESNPFQAKGALHTAFSPQGYYYGPLGTFRNIPDLGKYAIFLQLRDPRDVLTSLYFSTRYSHALISPKVIRRRKQSLSISIDEFVLKGVDEYVPIYEQYCQQLISRRDVLFLKYEDMVADFPGWVARLSLHLGLSEQTAALDRILQQADFSVRSEDEHSQRRQVTPGDHQRKLQPETVEGLTTSFKSVLNVLGYK